MKRFGTVLASVLLGSMIAGCDSGGIKEGSPAEPVTGQVSDQFRATMEKAGDKMTKGQVGGKKNVPKNVPAATTTNPEAPK